jgi:hypothetical protein
MLIQNISTLLAFNVQSQSVITSMVYNEMSVIISVSKCAVNMHIIYIVKLFGNSESQSLNLFVIMGNLKVQV